MEEKVKISILLSLYGNLLTKTQKKYMDLYYNEDFSLSEIGESEHITRQAVRTILLKSKNKLFEYEEKINFMKKESEIKSIIEELNKKSVDKSIKELISKIDNKLDY